MAEVTALRRALDDARHAHAQQLGELLSRIQLAEIAVKAAAAGSAKATYGHVEGVVEEIRPEDVGDTATGQTEY